MTSDEKQKICENIFLYITRAYLKSPILSSF